MKRDSEEEHMVRYLLGQLPVEEQTELEDRYLGDRTFFEQVCAIEDDLIEDYLSGSLPGSVRAQFERVYRTSPERYKRVKVAQDLRETLKLQQSGRNLPETSALEVPEPVDRTANLLSYVLVPGLLRDADEGSLTIGLGPRQSEIVLDLELNAAVDEFTSFQAILKSGRGDTMFSKDGLEAASAGSGFRVRMVVPASLFHPGDYTIDLQGATAAGLELIDIYYFHVTRGEPGTGSPLVI